MNIKTLKSLPVLEQGDFPSLPELPPGDIFFIPDPPGWRDEKKLVASVAITACIRAGKWEAIKASLFYKLFNEHPLIGFGNHVIINEFRRMIKSKELVTVRFNFNNVKYIIPKPVMMAEIMLDDPRNFWILTAKLK